MMFTIFSDIDVGELLKLESLLTQVKSGVTGMNYWDKESNQQIY